MENVLIFTHNDLDGIGCQIVAIKAAQALGYTYQVHSCNYHNVDYKIQKAINTGLKDVKMIIIADISVNKKTAQMLDTIYKSDTGIEIKLRDHHQTAEWLNYYDWAFVTEGFDGKDYCGTYLIANDFPEILDELKIFIKCVNDWDVWTWKKENNEYAPMLNNLLSVIGRKEFRQYILNTYYDEFSYLVIKEPKDLFTEWAKNIVQAKEYMLKKTANSCYKKMQTTTLNIDGYSYISGIIFVNEDISSVCDIVLNRAEKDGLDIDILIAVGLPRNISFRTNKDLEIPLGEIASRLTGQGGGHPKSAGAVIYESTFKSTLEYFFTNLTKRSEKGVYINNIM